MKRPEQILQQGVFENLKPLMILQRYKQFLAFQIKNESGVGGRKGAIIGAIASSMGMMAGVSDTLFVFASGKIAFVEFKALKPLKRGERSPDDLLSKSQEDFRDRVTAFGFEYRVIAAQNVQCALKQVYGLLRENGVKV